MIETLGQGVTIVDGNGRFTYVNPAYAHMVGRSPEELIGKSPRDFTHPDDWETLRQAWQQRCSNQTTTYETRLLRPDGCVVHVQITGVPHPQNKNVAAAFTIVTDVTERKETEARLQQEKQLSEDIIDSLPGSFYIFDNAGHLVRWNKRMETIPGYTAAEVAQMGPLDFIAPDDRASVTDAIEVVFTKGQGTVEAQFLFKNGQQQPHLFTGQRILINDQPYLIGIALDITDRVKAEESLQASEERYRSLVHSVGDIIFQIDTAGRWTFLNNAWTEITGFSLAESLGQSCLQNVSPDDREAYETEIQHLLAGETDFCYHQVRHLTQTGEYRWLEAYGRCSYDAAGKPQGISGLLRDITERKQREQELESIVTVTQALRQANTRAQILPIILEQAGELLQASGAMFINHLHSENVQIELAWGAWQSLSGQAMPPELNLADFTTDSDAPFIITDAQRNLTEQYATGLQPHWTLLVHYQSNSCTTSKHLALLP